MDKYLFFPGFTISHPIKKPCVVDVKDNRGGRWVMSRWSAARLVCRLRKSRKRMRRWDRLPVDVVFDAKGVQSDCLH